MLLKAEGGHTAMPETVLDPVRIHDLARIAASG
jgi:hypothetical protein